MVVRGKYRVVAENNSRKLRFGWRVRKSLSEEVSWRIRRIRGKEGGKNFPGAEMQTKLCHLSRNWEQGLRGHNAGSRRKGKSERTWRSRWWAQHAPPCALGKNFGAFPQHCRRSRAVGPFNQQEAWRLNFKESFWFLWRWNYSRGGRSDRQAGEGAWNRMVALGKEGRTDARYVV